MSEFILKPVPSCITLGGEEMKKGRDSTLNESQNSLSQDSLAIYAYGRLMFKLVMVV